MKKLKEGCQNCSMCQLVTETVTGARIKNPYYQCLADVTDECYKDMSMYEEETK